MSEKTTDIPKPTPPAFNDAIKAINSQCCNLICIEAMCRASPYLEQERFTTAITLALIKMMEQDVDKFNVIMGAYDVLVVNMPFERKQLQGSIRDGYTPLMKDLLHETISLFFMGNLPSICDGNYIYNGVDITPKGLSVWYKNKD